MPRISVSRSVLIEAPVARVFDEVRAFKGWPRWSPWLIADPECSIQFGEDQYSWDGKICGAGEMSVADEGAPEWIEHDLLFLKPFKSRAKTRMSFAEKGGGTEVTWTMDSSLPFFLFWMCRSMEGFIGRDYERGLGMLKELLEQGTISSRLEFSGPEKFEGLNGVGIRTTCEMEGMPAQMGRDMARIQKEFPEGSGFSIVEDWSVAKKSVTYFMGRSVETTPGNIPEGLEMVTIPPVEIYVVRHFGAYRHLGNGWAAGMMHGRAKQFRQSRRVAPFEIYENDNPENGEVKICLPMK